MQNLQRKLIKGLVLGYEKFSSYYLTFLNRPKQTSAMDLWPDNRAIQEKVAIVIQGPLLHEYAFTLETVRLYKKIFPKAIIIVSTWKGEDENVLKQIENLGATIVRSDKPSYRGPFNVNMQAVSAYAGMKKAKELGALYALKSRTDQRLQAPNGLEFMISLIETFPYKAPYPKQKKRIVACSKETLKYRPYGVTDMNVFGDIDDMLLYWGAPMDMRPAGTGGVTPTIRDFAEARICEIYLATEFMNKIGRKPLWTLKDAWDFYADHIVIADLESLDVYWRKYDHWHSNRFLDYDHVRTNQDLSFREWLNIYTHRDRYVPEEILSLPFRGVIKNPHEKNN
jgi:hypothetical protein